MKMCPGGGSYEDGGKSALLRLVLDRLVVKGMVGMASALMREAGDGALRYPKSPGWLRGAKVLQHVIQDFCDGGSGVLLYGLMLCGVCVEQIAVNDGCV